MFCKSRIITDKPKNVAAYDMAKIKKSGFFIKNKVPYEESFSP